jgi:hypothetical protein
MILRSSSVPVPHGVTVPLVQQRVFFGKAHLIDKTYPRRHTANPPKEIHRVEPLFFNSVSMHAVRLRRCRGVRVPACTRTS